MFSATLFTTLLKVVVLLNGMTALPVTNRLYTFNQIPVMPRDVNDLEPNHIKMAMVDVAATIAEVENLLRTDPSLPRLTRGEIEELFENVTNEEYERSLLRGDHDRAKHMRALMLVLPYNTNNISPDKLQDLYTRPPITKVVGSASNTSPKVIPQTILVQPDRGTPFNSPNVTTYKPVLTSKPIMTSKPIVPFHKPTTFHPVAQPQFIPQQNQQFAAMPQFVPQQKPALPAYKISSPTYKTSSPAYKPAATRLEPVQTTFRPLEVPKQPPQQFSTFYNADAVKLPTKTASQPPPVRENVKDILASIGLTMDTTTTTSTTTTTELPIVVESTPNPELTPEIQELLQSFGLLKEHPVKKFKLEDSAPFDDFIPRGASSQNIFAEKEPDSPKISDFKPLPASLKNNDYKLSQAPELTSKDFEAFKPIPRENSKELNNEFEEFLKSYGLIENKGRNMKALSTDTEEVTPHQTLSTSTTTSTTPSPDKMNVMPEINADLLTPSFLNVLGSLGIGTIQNPDALPIKAPRFEESISQKTPAEQEDYKKLHMLLETIQQLDKLNANLTEDELDRLNLRHYNLSESLLAIGPEPLGSGDYDQAKNEVKRQSEESNEQSAPEKFSFDLQLSQEVLQAPYSAREEVPKSSEVFTVVNAVSVNSPETETAAEGSDTVETSDNADATDTVEASATTTEAVATVTAAATTTTPAPSTSSTTEESRNGAIADLADSFAGGIDPVTEEPLPPPRKNGFYFLSDINSFLEVGDGDDKVEVRFNPQVGDPSRFLPISVP